MRVSRCVFIESMCQAKSGLIDKFGGNPDDLGGRYVIHRSSLLSIDERDETVPIMFSKACESRYPTYHFDHRR